MPAVRNVLRHVKVETAKRRRICGRNKSQHRIVKGERCLVIQSGQESDNYCMPCAAEILKLAEERIRSIHSELSQSE